MSFLVSIITPSYNSSDFISETIVSVLSQTFSDWEMIIVDDCSSDSSVDIVEEFSATESRIRLIRLDQNSGAAVARNTAIQMANGRYIAFLDSDDVWFPHKLEKQIGFMQKTGCPFSFSAYDKINAQGEVIGSVGVPSRVNYSQLLKTNVIGCLTAVYDIQYFGKLEMPLIRKRQDFGLWLLLLKKTDYACGIQEPLGQYRVRSDSMTANKRNAAICTWHLYRKVERLSLLKSTYCFAHYSVRGLMRTKAPGLARLLGILP